MSLLSPPMLGVGVGIIMLLLLLEESARATRCYKKDVLLALRLVRIETWSSWLIQEWLRLKVASL